MRVRTHWAAAIGLGLVVLSGCAGGASTEPGASAAASAGPSAGSSEGAPPSTAPSEGTVPSAAPSEGASAEPSMGGGMGAGVCELVTPSEASGVLGVPVEMEVLPGYGGSDTCDVQSDGAPVAAWVLTRSDPASGLMASFIFSALETSPGWVSVSGLGDKAGYDPTQALLVVLKGEAMVSISVFDDGMSDEQRLDLMKRLGAFAAGRL